MELYFALLSGGGGLRRRFINLWFVFFEKRWCYLALAALNKQRRPGLLGSLCQFLDQITVETTQGLVVWKPQSQNQEENPSSDGQGREARKEGHSQVHRERAS